jgi:hypothetical protein
VAKGLSLSPAEATATFRRVLRVLLVPNRCPTDRRRDDRIPRYQSLPQDGRDCWRPKNPVPRLDVAGTVVATGANVSRFTVGGEVFGIGQGSVAQYTCASEDKLARKPASLSFDQAALGRVEGQRPVSAKNAQIASVALGPRGSV